MECEALLSPTTSEWRRIQLIARMLPTGLVSHKASENANFVSKARTSVRLAFSDQVAVPKHVLVRFLEKKPCC